MGFDAASARAASAGLGALAQRARENGQTILKAAHDACRLPEDRVLHGFRAGATAFLGSPEGKAALRKGQGRSRPTRRQPTHPRRLRSAAGRLRERARFGLTRPSR